MTLRVGLLKILTGNPGSISVGKPAGESAGMLRRLVSRKAVKLMFAASKEDQ